MLDNHLVKTKLFGQFGLDNKRIMLQRSLTSLDVSRSCYLFSSDFLLQIEKYIFHILATAELYNRLSKQEKAFAKT